MTKLKQILQEKLCRENGEPMTKQELVFLFLERQILPMKAL